MVVVSSSSGGSSSGSSNAGSKNMSTCSYEPTPFHHTTGERGHTMTCSLSFHITPAQSKPNLTPHPTPLLLPMSQRHSTTPQGGRGHTILLSIFLHYTSPIQTQLNPTPHTTRGGGMTIGGGGGSVAGPGSYIYIYMYVYIHSNWTKSLLTDSFSLFQILKHELSWKGFFHLRW